ncbi:TraR/DksA family transcriptional regulator [Streptomyces sp. NPDC029526]|uniref:TraR/DksA family transcriptional regulator n=1 Tax=Streptomyces sp. NPDC029526 TaxID=3155728 RepID=UPI0033EED4CB
MKATAGTGEAGADTATEAGGKPAGKRSATGRRGTSGRKAAGAGDGTAARKGKGKGEDATRKGKGEDATRKGKGEDATGDGGGTHDTAGRGTATDADADGTAPQTGATTVGAKKTPGTATAATTAVPKARIGAAEPGDLAVRPGEEPWTPEEVEEARAGLMSEVLRLREEISSSERSLAGLMRDSGDGAGDDQADTGTKNITREHELALAANAREMLTQSEHALQRLDTGTYGLCENCGNPIGKARMQAFPRATLCVECKQKQERRF